MLFLGTDTRSNYIYSRLYHPLANPMTKRFAKASILLVSLVGSVLSDSLNPEEALVIIQGATFDTLNFVAIESEENSFLGDATHISRVSYVNDVWLLEQRDVRESEWDRSGILVRDGVAYFAALDPPRLFGGDCVVCHTNGPRALYGPVVDGEPKVAVWMNELIGRDEVVRAYLPPDDPLRESDQLKLPVCAKCHDGKKRSTIYGIQVRSMYVQTEKGRMPPDREMEEVEKHELYRWMRHQVDTLW